MYTTYRGYFENGRFISPELTTIPNNIEVHVTIIGGEVSPVKTKAQQQNEALKRFSAAMKEIDDEPLDEEFFGIINSGVIIDSGVDL